MDWADPVANSLDQQLQEVTDSSPLQQNGFQILGTQLAKPFSYFCSNRSIADSICAEWSSQIKRVSTRSLGNQTNALVAKTIGAVRPGTVTEGGCRRNLMQKSKCLLWFALLDWRVSVLQSVS
jgi:hypothetical protein